MPGGMKTMLVFLLLSVLVVLGILITVAFMTLVERKLISPIQNRRGPNTVGYLGILQPFADALKLIIKESIFPRNARFVIFVVAPLISLFFALAAWAFVPLSYDVILVDTNIGVFFIFVSSILHIYGVILSGWASGSRYSFLGALRSTAQLVAYDITVGTIICCIALFTQSLNLLSIVEFQDYNGWLIFYLPVLFCIFFVASLAETNRHPFDLPEAESELVGGYTTEYASSYFAYFFLGEYCSILLMVFLINHIFLGGWLSLFGNVLSFPLYCTKILVIYYIFIIVRAAIPRYRYDQLMRIGWKFILPLSLSMLVIIAVTLLITSI
jgi:NADH-quinone oxidoreductase subunit H